MAQTIKQNSLKSKPYTGMFFVIVYAYIFNET